MKGKIRGWALLLCLASLPLTYPVVLCMILALGQESGRKMVFVIGDSFSGPMRELFSAS